MSALAILAIAVGGVFALYVGIVLLWALLDIYIQEKQWQEWKAYWKNRDTEGEE